MVTYTYIYIHVFILSSHRQGLSCTTGYAEWLRDESSQCAGARHRTCIGSGGSRTWKEKNQRYQENLDFCGTMSNMSNMSNRLMWQLTSPCTTYHCHITVISPPTHAWRFKSIRTLISSPECSHNMRNVCNVCNVHVLGSWGATILTPPASKMLTSHGRREKYIDSGWLR